jgi:hypothetical protein
MDYFLHILKERCSIEMLNNFFSNTFRFVFIQRVKKAE